MMVGHVDHHMASLHEKYLPVAITLWGSRQAPKAMTNNLPADRVFPLLFSKSISSTL